MSHYAELKDENTTLKNQRDAAILLSRNILERITDPSRLHPFYKEELEEWGDTLNRLMENKTC